MGTGSIEGQVLRHRIYGWVCAACLLAACIPGAVHAAGEPGEFLRYGTGVRALSMGRAYVAAAEDATAVYWNPANLGLVERMRADFMYSALYEGYTYSSLAGVLPALSGDNYGAHMVILKSPSVTKRSASGLADGSFEDSKMALGVGYGRQITGQFHAGATLQGIMQSLDGNGDIYGNLNAGVLYKFNSDLRFGFTVHNLMSLKLSGDSSDSYPLKWRAGVLYTLLRDKLRISMDMYSESDNLSYATGLEYVVLDNIRARVGANAEEFTLGAGIAINDFEVDAGYSVHQELGGLMRVSVGYLIGESIRDIKLRDSQVLFDEGKRFYKNGRFAEAIKRVNSALEKDPENRLKQKILEKLSVINREFEDIEYFERGAQRVPNATRLVNKSIVDYIEGNYTDAKDEVIYALFLAPKDKKIQKVAQIMRQEFPGEAIEGNDLLAEYLESALSYYEEKKYLLVVAMCQRALNLDPYSVTSYSRMGSAYFKLGKPDVAREMWKTALQIEPDNETIKKALELLGK